MKHRAVSVAKVTVPIKALLNRFALLFLILSTFAIMLLGKAEILAVERLRSGVVDIVAPIMEGLSRPISTVSTGIDRVENFFSVYEENESLREQNARLLEWHNAALALAAENSTLRKMLNFVPERGTFSAARVMGDRRRICALPCSLTAALPAVLRVEMPSSAARVSLAGSPRPDTNPLASF